jgi:hypothetical protein
MFCHLEMNTNRIDKQSIEDATREAEQRSLDFNPTERASLIRRMIVEIPLAISRGMTAEDLGLQNGFKMAMPTAEEPSVNPKYKEIKEFAEHYPELFKKIVGQQDLTPIRSMLAMLDKMAEGSISTHQASVIIGQKLVDRYVKPQLRGHGKGGRGH